MRGRSTQYAKSVASEVICTQNTWKSVSLSRTPVFLTRKMISPEKGFCLKVGLLLDDGAPYSGIGEQEFQPLRSKLKTDYTGVYEDLPADIVHRSYWQYGTGEHSSQYKKIIFSVLIDLESDQGDAIRIRHLVIQG